MKLGKFKEKSINLAFCILGNIIIGLGVALTKIADFGNDPFCGSCMAVSAFFAISYTGYTICYNSFLFIFEIIFGRKHIGIGTFVNWFLLCYAVEFFFWLFGGKTLITAALPLRLLFLALGLAASGLGLAIYQECDAGVSPYDVIPIMICERHPKAKFFWVRVVLDSLSVIIIVSFHGKVGVGTLATAFCLGPMIHFFRNTFCGILKSKQNQY